MGAPLELTDEQGQGVWAAPRPTLGLLVVASHCGTEHLKNQSRLPDLLCRHTIPFAKGKCIIEDHTVGHITSHYDNRLPKYKHYFKQIFIWRNMSDC
uniref:hypothetical protein n=1 Tax=Delftia acidovorans TaxID=80866 RepID=UPI001F3E5C12|nr:hypothetical protein [Delftia sp. RIT313]